MLFVLEGTLVGFLAMVFVAHIVCMELLSCISRELIFNSTIQLPFVYLCCTNRTLYVLTY